MAAGREGGDLPWGGKKKKGKKGGGKKKGLSDRSHEEGPWGF